MKLALADRDVYYADPLFVDVPLAELLSPRYAAAAPAADRPAAGLAGAAAGRSARREGAAGPGRDARRGLGGPAHDTTTCLVADGEGNVVAATPSGWSRRPGRPTGVWLGSRLQSFNTWEGHPNCIEPGKRPRITLTPTLVLKDGKPVLAVSVAGGDGQDQATLQLVLNAIDFGLAPAESVTAPRFGTNHFTGSFRQTPPALGSLLVYPEMAEATRKDLRARGHMITVQKPPLWGTTVLSIDPKSGLIRVAGDPKAGRHVGAY